MRVHRNLLHVKPAGLRRTFCRVLSGCCLLAVTAFTVRAQPLTFTTFAGPAGGPGSFDGNGAAVRFNSPTGVATDSGGNVYVADRNNSTIRKITPAGVVTTLAGSALLIGSADGTGSAARFNFPTGVATDSGNVYVADTEAHTIRKITSAGLVTTLAGSAGLSGSADGTGSAARFYHPTGVATDSGGNIYVAEYLNHAIRKITPAGVVTTLAGSAGLIGSADGTGSAARFNFPTGVATDSGGNVYVADQFNHTIRKITPAAVVTTLAGSAGLRGNADGTGSAALFNQPNGVATDSGGNVYVADYTNNTIRVGRAALADVATIDRSTGSVGAARQLDTSPQTATSWQWTLIRQPSASAAQLTSASIRNPLFTPDVADLFVFQLTASNGVMTSITTVNLTATAGVKGDANGDGQVTVTDVFYLINFLFTNGPAPIGPADVNGDGQVTVTDIFYLINYLFAGGPPPR